MKNAFQSVIPRVTLGPLDKFGKIILVLYLSGVIRMCELLLCFDTRRRITSRWRA